MKIFQGEYSRGQENGKAYVKNKPYSLYPEEFIESFNHMKWDNEHCAEKLYSSAFLRELESHLASIGVPVSTMIPEKKQWRSDAEYKEHVLQNIAKRVELRKYNGKAV